MGSEIVESKLHGIEPALTARRAELVEVSSRVGLSPRSVLLGSLFTMAALGIALIVLLVVSLVTGSWSEPEEQEIK